MTHVTTIFPTYNERETVLEAIQRTRRELQAAGHTPSIVVVDDDSPDDTHAHVREEYKHDQLVSVVRRTATHGLASAVASGFREAPGDVYLVMDADLQHPPAAAPRVASPVTSGPADLAIGSRHLAGGSIASDWPLTRRLVSGVASVAASWELPDARRLSDPMSGFFAVDSTLVDRHEEQLRAPGFKILLEVIARCPVRTVHEVPFTFRERADGESSLSTGEYVRFVRHLARLSVAGRTDPEPLEVVRNA